MSNIAIRVENLGKWYRIGVNSPTQLLRRQVMSRFIPRAMAAREDDSGSNTSLWAVRNVDFEVKTGEVVGLIGGNGAGKSTMLKLLSRITAPTEGRVTVNGRMASLLEVGTGFHPELSGRENIYLNGAILGMQTSEIDRQLDEIIDFSGIERFIDTPVKRYSSGMRVRLGFAVAAHLNPEVLVIDEVLAVGDAGFQSRCIGKMSDIAGSGRTVLFVSHNMPAVKKLCPRSLLMVNGRVVMDDESEPVIDAYLAQFESGAEVMDVSGDAENRPGTGEARVTSVCLQSDSGEPKSTLKMGESASVKLEIEPDDDVVVWVQVVIKTYDDLVIARVSSRVTSDATFSLSKNENASVNCRLRNLNLASGRYVVNVQLYNERVMVDSLRRVLIFDVVPDDIYGTGRVPYGQNLVYLNADWDRN